MVRTISIPALALSLAITPARPAPSDPTVVVCTPHASPLWQSGWCDLPAPVDFRRGERLRLAVGGSASKVIVRLLPKGGDPNTPIGTIPTPFDVPASRYIEFTLGHDAIAVVSVSVHGGPQPFGQFTLKSGNGAATLLSVVRDPPSTGSRQQ